MCVCVYAHVSREHYNMQLRMPLMPCAVAGGSKKPEWIPMEVCKVLTDSECMGYECYACVAKGAPHAHRARAASCSLLTMLLIRW